MLEVPVYNQDGQKVDTIKVDPAKLGAGEGGEVNHALLKQAVVQYHANQRQGTVYTLARGEVAGSTRKMFKQKGTGNARTGGIRNPIKVGGGHAKQKRPKDWRQFMPVKAKRLARNQALLTKIQAGDLKLVVDFKLPEAKTKNVVKICKALGIDRSCVLALAEHSDTVYRAARNIDRMTVTTAAQLNAWDILKNRTVLMTKDGFSKLVG
jgi:large subunit ribosomal protein L4